MPSIETFMTFLLALTLLEISPGPDMMLTIATRSGRSDGLGIPGYILPFFDVRNS
ncbi:lysine exporter LysE/YggA [Klebsiella pneumoniae]|uniref:Lysine exporter LysE/YggA n=1 Tax=Klebsiella pneumoniae TaxID=573 RepID=A0A377W5R9_KLEPN|nr:lysine exporter LysE/YggA [Klebsiella pneumoniae]